MAEWQEWTGRNAGLFALLALLLALTAVIFLIVLYARQKRADRKAARRYEGMLRQMEENVRFSAAWSSRVWAMARTP